MIKAENKSHISEDVCFFASPDNHPWSYLFDCGRARYLNAGDCKSLRAVFITHTHIDHFCNFDTLLRHHVGMRRLVTIVGPSGIAANVQGKGLSYTWNLIHKRRVVYEVREVCGDRIHVYEMGPPDWEPRLITDYKIRNNIVFQEKGISVKARELDHKTPSLAYLLEEDSSINIGEFPYRPGPWIRELKEAKEQADDQRLIEVEAGKTLPAVELYALLFVKQGWKLGYAMDHLPCKKNHATMASLFEGVDELIIEAFFRDCDRNYALRHYHSTAYESGNFARKAKAKRLTIAHHSRRYFSDLEDLREEGYAAFYGKTPKYKNQPVARYEGKVEEEF